jgi:beta-glucosidase
MPHVSRRRSLAVLLLLTSAVTVAAQAPGTAVKPPAPAGPAAEDAVHHRALALLARMTVEEKAGQLNQAAGIVMPGLAEEKPDEAIRKGRVGSVLWLNDVKEINRLQRVAVEESRLKVPLLVGFDVVHGYRTSFPMPIAMAASWDPTVHERAQRVAAEDARASGINWTFAPMVDIARDARWGRMVEGAGEDPYLGAAMARAQVKGFQGDSFGPSSVLVSVKHFAAYGAAEGGRDYDGVYAPEVLMRNVYLEPFRAAVEAGAGNVMSAYMDLNDVPAGANRWLLWDVLRGDWKFKGFVVSDAMAVNSLVTHGMAKDREDAALKSMLAGQNMDMASGVLVEHVPALVASGRLTMAQLDQAVLPILEAKLRLGLFEHPYTDEARTEDTLNRESTRALARAFAARSMVLLRNDGRVLPLAKAPGRIALVGPFGDAATDMEGSWTVEGLFGAARRSRPVSVVQGLRARLGDAAQIDLVVAPRPEKKFRSMFDMFTGRPPEPPLAPEAAKAAIDAAVAAAARADVVVAVLGETPSMSGELASRATLDLPGIQQALLEAVTAVGKPVVLVLLNGRPLDIRWASEHVPAILEAWYPGTEGGHAVADVLFGDVNPGGKLPVSWPRIAGQSPLYYNHNLTQDPDNGPRFTSRYWDESSFPLYPFGHGLSYTTFTYANARLAAPRIAATGSTEVLVDVTNSGTVSGDTVAQVYIHQRAGSASRPQRELKGFRRVTLAPGETRTLTFPLGPGELRYWSPLSRTWVVEPGTFDVWVGEDSTARLHAELKVTGR